MIKVLYFARFRDALNCAEEKLQITDEITSVAKLASLLAERGDIWRETLNSGKVLVAINQEVADFNTEICDGDEVAFFPPVTGG